MRYFNVAGPCNSIEHYMINAATRMHGVEELTDMRYEKKRCAFAIIKLLDEMETNILSFNGLRLYVKIKINGNKFLGVLYYFCAKIYSNII
jgi:hypothetical protein